jgi:HSP20 family molecular chaperone IbpA
MYSANLEHLLDAFENELPAQWKTSSSFKSITPNYVVNELEDGKQEIVLSVVGHDPKNIKIEVTEDKVSIKSKKEEDSYSLIQDIDTTFTIGKDYDGTKTEAKFLNGLLVLTIDKKAERKAKLVTIKVG